MKELPGQALVGARIALAVEWIAHAGVVDMTHMHANLVRATGKQMALNERIAVVKTHGIEALEDLKGRNGLAGERIVRNRHLDTVARRSGNTGIDGALVHGDVPVDKRDIAAVERTRANEI